MYLQEIINVSGLGKNVYVGASQMLFKWGLFDNKIQWAITHSYQFWLPWPIFKVTGEFENIMCYIFQFWIWVVWAFFGFFLSFSIVLKWLCITFDYLIHPQVRNLNLFRMLSCRYVWEGDHSIQSKQTQLSRPPRRLLPIHPTDTVCSVESDSESVGPTALALPNQHDSLLRWWHYLLPALVPQSSHILPRTRSLSLILPVLLPLGFTKGVGYSWAYCYILATNVGNTICLKSSDTEAYIGGNTMLQSMYLSC